MNGPVLSIVILAIATVLISGVMIYYRIPQVYAQEEDTGVQTIYFSQTRGGGSRKRTDSRLPAQ